MRSDNTPGQTSDYLGFDLVMDDNLPEPAVLLADRGYASDKVRETMEARNVVPVIPMRKSPKLCVAVDRTLYRQRNLVERRFNKLKNARRVATLSTSLRPDVISAVTLLFRPTSTATTLEVPLAASYILTV
jgi:transposase